MSAKSVPPPTFDEKSQTWKEYRKELNMWKALTSLEEKKQGPALYLALVGKAKEVVKDIDEDQIFCESGLENIVSVLDSVFKKDENQESYLAYKQFEEFRRAKSMNVKDFVIKFESLHSKLKSLNMALPEGVKAYRLLNSANLTDEETHLCLATTSDFKYEDMKAQVMKICGDDVASTSYKLENLCVKEEGFHAHSENRSRQNTYDN